jgi:hypothetical protein
MSNWGSGPRKRSRILPDYRSDLLAKDAAPLPTQNIHVASNTRVSINPPCASNPGLAVEDSKLIEPEYFFHAASHGNARLPCTNNDHRVIRVAIGVIAIILVDCRTEHIEM